jgi:hypothetical protein
MAQMLATVKRSIQSALLVTLEGAGALASVIGAPIALALGKLFLAAILAAIALGIFLRFAGRRAAPAPMPSPTPWWLVSCNALASLVEVAALVEATKLPVRFDQPGFSPWNWALVLVALWVAYALQARLLKRLVRRPSRSIEPQ